MRGSPFDGRVGLPVHGGAEKQGQHRRQKRQGGGGAAARARVRAWRSRCRSASLERRASASGPIATAFRRRYSRWASAVLQGAPDFVFGYRVVLTIEAKARGQRSNRGTAKGG